MLFYLRENTVFNLMYCPSKPTQHDSGIFVFEVWYLGKWTRWQLSGPTEECYY